MHAFLRTGADAIDEAARRLRTASLEGRACEPVRDLIADGGVAAAYAVQERLTRHRIDDGARVVGRKVGLTSLAVQAQLGVEQPDFGVLFDDMEFGENAELPTHLLLQPKVEAEIAFVLGADLSGGSLDAARVRHAVEYAVAALEIVDSRIAGWDITLVDTVADNASSGLYVLGAERRTLDEFEPFEAEMRMFVDDIQVSSGIGADCLGDPLEALAWLARTASDLGAPLRAGDVVLSGALGPMHPVHPGATVSAEITGLGAVKAKFSATHDGGRT